MERWQNKVAVVTGASAGIGAACCKELLAAGMIVVGLARRLERMEKEFKPSLPADQQSRFHPYRCDVSKDEDIVAAFAWIEKHLGGVDVLINNAGIVRQTQIVAENNTADLKAVLDTNVLGVALCTREAFRSMKKRDVDGHVILINSVAGHTIPNVPEMNLNIYPASKFAVTAMNEIFRQEFLKNKTKIKVTSLSPGAVKTEIVGDYEFPPEIPFLNSEDISNAVLYCLSTPPHVQIFEMIVKPVGEIY